MSPVLNGGALGPPSRVLTPNSPTYSSSLWWRLLLWGEGTQELIKETEPLRQLGPLPLASGRVPPFPPNPHQTTLTPGLGLELVFLVVTAEA